VVAGSGKAKRTLAADDRTPAATSSSDVVMSILVPSK